MPPEPSVVHDQGGLTGVMFIGDPHLASRVPGFRKDDYPNVILAKLRHALAYARTNRLLPVLLGDLFDFPRDNANWLLVELHEMLPPGTLAVYGNHDCKENTPTANDSIRVLIAGGRLRILSEAEPWSGEMNGCSVVIGGTSWGLPLPERFGREPFVSPGRPSFVLWATHHDLQFPGYDAARTTCRAIDGIDLAVNGHIHRDLGEVLAGTTRWVNPGNISRLARSDGSRSHKPGVLRVDVAPAGLTLSRIELPHQPFDDVFHAEVVSAPVETGPGVFITEVARLLSPRTSDGLGLSAFLDANLGQCPPAVAAEIRQLANNVVQRTGGNTP